MFTTQEELWRYLLDGGKVKGIGWKEGYLHFCKGTLIDHKGVPVFYSHEFFDPTLWEPCLTSSLSIADIVEYLEASLRGGLIDKDREAVYKEILYIFTR